MKKAMIPLMIASVLVFALGFSVNQATAEELKWKVTSYISNIQNIPVGDEEGHRLAVFERRGAVIFEDGETAALVGTGTTDATKDGQGGSSYYQFTFKDGSTIWSKWQFTGKLPPGEKLMTIEPKAEFIKGTGRFDGIKGNFTCKGGFITPVTQDKTKGDIVLECSGTRILPHK